MINIKLKERNKEIAAPDDTAVRVALWRALHLQVDPPPHVFADEVGLKLVGPDEGWRSRPDMGPFTRPFRASILARARFLEDLVEQETARGVGQYVILGAGLDTLPSVDRSWARVCSSSRSIDPARKHGNNSA